MTIAAGAQDFSGYRTGNYTGVNGVFYNPANIADSRYRWDFNLFSVSTAIGNNKALFKLKDIGNTLDGDSIKNKIFAEGSGPSSGLASVVLQGPSVMFNLNKKSAMAVTTRARVMANIVDIDSKLARQIIDDNAGNIGFPYTVSSATNMAVNANAWTEFGLSYAREILDKGKHYFKGGVSLKYLAGAANASVNIGSLNGTINYDAVKNESYLTNASGRMGLNFGGINISDFEANDLLSFKSTGFGADIGFVYEFRPDTASLRNEWGEMRRDLNKYKLRVGVALLDVGGISYTRDLSRSGAYNVHIGSTQRFYLSSLADASLDHFKDTLNKYPQYFTEDKTATASSYRISLPTTLQLDVDYRVNNGFYVNGAAQFGLTNTSKNIGNGQYYSSFTLTPRFETGGFGVYLPLGSNALTGFTGGLAIRFGNIILGSGSILSALGGSKQADFFIGAHFGSKQKNKAPKKNVSNDSNSSSVNQ
ncbi:hypothetical protein GCM10023229_07740 [Flavisolibacter ginsenosidimutans]